MDSGVESLQYTLACLFHHHFINQDLRNQFPQICVETGFQQWIKWLCVIYQVKVYLHAMV